MSKVFVLDTNKNPLAPTHQGNARRLLTSGFAAVYRRYPFTIILLRPVDMPDKGSRPFASLKGRLLKIDPGSKTTGIAIVNQQTGEVEFAAELQHRGHQIKSDLESRRASRRSRRSRKTRYRKPRFLNRTKPKGWLAPSLMSRVYNITTWVRRLRNLCPIQAISMELVRFDMQKMQNPNIDGIEYQQGELLGYEVREYLLEKWGRKCAYCGVENVPLEVEHIVPKSRGGSNRVSNLTLACTPCNVKKGTQTAEEFGQPQIQAKARLPLRDAAVVNATRWKLYETLQSTGLDVEVGTGGRTKFNRRKQGLPKTHWLDAACVGESTPDMLRVEKVLPLWIRATGHGSRQMCQVDRFGFPRTKPKGAKKVKGFATGDMVKAIVTKGKKIGTYVGRVAVRASGSFNIKTASNTIQGIGYRYCQLLYRVDGYHYEQRGAVSDFGSTKLCAPKIAPA